MRGGASMCMIVRARYMHGECTVRCTHCACSISGWRVVACRTNFDTLRT